MYLVFTRMSDESYCRRLRSLLLYLCYVFRALILPCVLVLLFSFVSSKRCSVTSSRSGGCLFRNSKAVDFNDSKLTHIRHVFSRSVRKGVCFIRSAIFTVPRPVWWVSWPALVTSLSVVSNSWLTLVTTLSVVSYSRNSWPKLATTLSVVSYSWPTLVTTLSVVR